MYRTCQILHDPYIEVKGHVTFVGTASGHPDQD